MKLSAVPKSLPYSFTKSLADHPGHDGTGASKLQELNRNNSITKTNSPTKKSRVSYMTAN